MMSMAEGMACLFPFRLAVLCELCGPSRALRLRISVSDNPIRSRKGREGPQSSQSCLVRSLLVGHHGNSMAKPKLAGPRPEWLKVRIRANETFDGVNRMINDLSL